MKQLVIWGEKMQIWTDSEYTELSGPSFVSRIWTGQDDDISEIQLDDLEGQNKALSLIGTIPWLLVRCSDWTMVPLENLVAASRGTGTRIAVSINKEIELDGAAFALGIGVDAVLVPEDLIHPASKVASRRGKTMEETIERSPIMSQAEVLSVENAGFGERVCIDLTKRLEKGQGMAIGSTSHLLPIVHGETLSSEFVPERPFRVNAGAIHSYVLMADGSTKYLSELNSGEEVSIFSIDGNQEKATIGRLKIEPRPLLIVRFSDEEMEGQSVLQQAETVRLVTDKGEIVPITELGIGTKILVFSDSRLRHIGLALEGSVREK